jgi:phosphoribosylformylglycinamidine cyclo-ligase
MSEDAYSKAGVNIDAGDELVQNIKPLARSTHRSEVMSGLGGFGGFFALKAGYKDPVLVSGTDGVGTKLLVAQQAGQHDTIGIDLVAMCVNDIVVSGAEPLFFLDYFATGKLQPSEATQVVAGIAAGCRQAGCALIGGETAEMPGMYAPGHYDLAGFTVGIVERDKIIDGSTIEAGDAVIGLPSSGIHSNGYSLVRKVLLQDGGFDLNEDPCDLGHSLKEELLKPTTIYVQQVLALRDQVELRGLAHITGGGIEENLPRVLPEGLGASINTSTWEWPAIFRLLQQTGELSLLDMRRTFNLGIGMILIVPANQTLRACEISGGSHIGQVIEGDGVRWM